MKSFFKATWWIFAIAILGVGLSTLGGCVPSWFHHDSPKPATPTVTLSPIPTVTPSPTPCEMVVHLAGVPQMTRENKDTLNKQCLFCCVAPGGKSIVAIIQRYYQRDWPEGPWTQVWRLEAPSSGNPDQVVSPWALCKPLPSGNASFRIVASGNSVMVKCIQTGDIETLATDHKIEFGSFKEDGGCRIPGYEPFPSSARIVAPLPVICGGGK